MDNIKNVEHLVLRKLCAEIQKSRGIPEADAAAVSDCLVGANLMGLDTHGVIRLKFYMDRVKAGGNNAVPNMRVVVCRVCPAACRGRSVSIPSF